VASTIVVLMGVEIIAETETPDGQRFQ